MLRIGPLFPQNRLVIAPMAGVTDRPFRKLCRELGAGYAVSEMVASKPDLWQTPKSMRRMNHDGEHAPIAVQIAGNDPAMMAEAAQFNVSRGAQIIDINMGCPKEGVQGRCWFRFAARRGSGCPYPEAVVNAVEVPVTLKTAPAGAPRTAMPFASRKSPGRRNSGLCTAARVPATSTTARSNTTASVT